MARGRAGQSAAQLISILAAASLSLKRVSWGLFWLSVRNAVAGLPLISTWQALALARAAGTVVMPHVRTALNGQIAGTSAVMEAVETIADKAASWEHHLMMRQPNIVNGVLVLDQEPGNGIEIDWDAVERFSPSFVRMDFE